MGSKLCRGRCIGLKHQMSNHKRYESGQKYCPKCASWSDTKEVRCHCCNGVYRTRPRLTHCKSEQRWAKAY